MTGSPHAHRIALRHERDRAAIERPALRHVGTVAVNLRVAILRAYERYGSSDVATLSVFEDLEGLVTDLSVASHLQGRLRSIRTAGAHIGQRLSRTRALKRVPITLYKQATDALAARMLLEPHEIADLRNVYRPSALEVCRNVSTAVERAAEQAAYQIVREGAHVRQGMGILRDRLDAAGLGTRAPWLLETLVRTQTMLAYGAGRWNANDDPAIREILWGYEYATVGDDRVRPTHAALDGVRLPRDDPKWGEITPPNGFNCRCTTIEVYDAAEAVGVPAVAEIGGATVIPGPDAGWDFHPGTVYGDVLRITRTRRAASRAA